MHVLTYTAMSDILPTFKTFAKLQNFNITKLKKLQKIYKITNLQYCKVAKFTE